MRPPEGFVARKRTKKTSKRATPKKTADPVQELSPAILEDDSSGIRIEMDDVDAEAWGRVMAELESASLKAQNKALQLQVSERDWVAQQKSLREELQALQSGMVGLQKRYQGVVDRLAKKYDIDPKHVAIDFEARLLYDTRKIGDAEVPGGEK